MKTLLITSIFSLLFLSAHALISPLDSVGIRTINQRNYIVHKVEKGETLYALSRRYQVEVQSIMDANSGSDKGINVGQELLIPTKALVQQVPSRSRDNTQSQGSVQGQVIHTVTAGESLYTIGQKYGVSVGDIRTWNNMRNNTLSLGQKLTIRLSPDKAAEINQRKEVMETHGKKIHVVSRGETLYSIAGNYGISVGDLREWNRLESNAIGVGQELIVGYLEGKEEKVEIVQELKTEEKTGGDVEVQTMTVPEPEMKEAESTDDAKKVTERGIAQVIEGSESTRKYLALHRNAPIGTIMQIKNEMNDLSVFVRVIGKIPDTDDNKIILIKVSRVAYDRLGAIDDQFPVEITYHP